MESLIPTITLTEFKKLKAPEIKRLKSCEVTADGEYLFTFVNSQTGYIREQAKNLGVLGNPIRGETLEEILSNVPV